MHAIEENKPGLSQPFSINQTGTLLTRHLAHFVSAIDSVLVAPVYWIASRTARRRHAARSRGTRLKCSIAQRIVRLQSGLLGDVKPVGGGVSELRVDHGLGYRVYFVQRGRVLIVLLCGGDKRTQQRDIERAKALTADLED